MLYAKSTGGFYDPAIHGSGIPADAVEITYTQYQDLLAGQSSGQIISANQDGYPVLTDPPAPTADQVKISQLGIIATDFQLAANANVTDSSGGVWTGGESSALSIYGAVQLAQAGGATTVTLFDASNAPHSLTIAQGTAVAAAIGAAYQTAFAKYQGLKVQIANATTVEAVQAINW